MNTFADHAGTFSFTPLQFNAAQEAMLPVTVPQYPSGPCLSVLFTENRVRVYAFRPDRTKLMGFLMDRLNKQIHIHVVEGPNFLANITRYRETFSSIIEEEIRPVTGTKLVVNEIAEHRKDAPSWMFAVTWRASQEDRCLATGLMLLAAAKRSMVELVQIRYLDQITG